jgi:soluble lytic murein transglycosylase-like protein
MFALAAVFLGTMVIRPPISGIGTNPNQPPLERALVLEPAPEHIVETAAPTQLATLGQARFTPAVERWRPISRDATRTVQRVTAVKLEEDVLLALIAVESEGKPTARSAAGAVGLAQVMPSTFDDLRTRYNDVLPTASLEEPRFNVLAGALYLADCTRALEADLSDPDQLALVLHAYNMGLRAAAEWRDSGVRTVDADHETWSARGLPTETIEHTRRVIAAMQSGGL